jgi:hypothetical protein
MPRPDGRVRPGQKLDTAFSARAWNRAQDAADLVLGDRGGINVTPADKRVSRLIVPCLVSTIYDGVTVGHAVQLGGPVQPIPVLNPEIKDPPDDFVVPSLFGLSGEVVRAQSFASAANTQQLHQQFRQRSVMVIGVIVGGIEMPKPGTQNAKFVDVCVRGPCLARVRVRGANSTLSLRLRPAFIRRPTDTPEILHGCLEEADEGPAGLITSLYFNGQPYIAKYGSGASAGERTDITWGVVML